MIGTMMAMMHICVSVRADQVTVHRKFTGTPIIDRQSSIHETLMT